MKVGNGHHYNVISTQGHPPPRMSFVFFFVIMKSYAETFYKSKAWQDCRDSFFKSRKGLCEICLKGGIITGAEIVHHKIHISPDNISNPEITLNWDNLECLCRIHHAETHSGKVRRYMVDDMGNISPLER